MPEISCIILNVQELLYLPFDYDYRFDFLQPGTGRNCKEINSIRSMSSTILFRWNCKWIYEKYFSCHYFCTPFKLLSNSFNNQFLFQIDGYLSPVTKENTIARKTTRFRTFPDHLLIQLKKFDIDEKWQPYKVLGIIIGVINYHMSQAIVFYGMYRYNQYF